MPAGDLTLNTPVTKTLPGFSLTRLDVDLVRSAMTFYFVDALAALHTVIATDVGGCIGFDVAGNTISDGLLRAAVTGEFTKLIGIIFGPATGNANARRSAAVQALKDDLVITFTGTVG